MSQEFSGITIDEVIEHIIRFLRKYKVVIFSTEKRNDRYNLNIVIGDEAIEK